MSLRYPGNSGPVARLAASCLCACLFVCGSTAGASAGASDRVVRFMGASETAGYGLRDGEPAYPAILERRCGFVARVDGEPNKPVLFRTIKSTGSGVVYFVSQFDAYLQPTEGDLKGWLATAGRAREIVLEAPLLPDTDGVIAAYQRRFYRNMDKAATEEGAITVLLRLPAEAGAYLQADGLHPNERGQLLIADTLEPRLIAARLCPKGERSQ